MEKPDYRINLERLLELFPGKAAINVKDVANVLGCDERRVRSSISRKRNPLPAVRLGGQYSISIPSFARWLSSSER
ncbi:MAG: hypothetical protein J6K52_01845 [Clostridia bacterium]|nr:hypothetical protein [Clostridia bacterium]